MAIKYRYRIVIDKNYKCLSYRVHHQIFYTGIFGLLQNIITSPYWYDISGYETIEKARQYIYEEMNPPIKEKLIILETYNPE